nr:deoxyribodipyrimidine photo-lyase [uncultured Flavobacterium sp.]
MNKEKIAIFWFRRDLRIEDNHGLFQALNSGYKVLPIFIFDPIILNCFEDKQDRRVDYIHQALQNINKKLAPFNSGIDFFFKTPIEVFEELTSKYNIEKVFCNHDYEPKAIHRDLEVQNFLKTQSVDFHSYKDQVRFEKYDILKADNTPYTVFTPYSKKWKLLLKNELLPYYDSENYLNHLIQKADFQKFSLEEIGFNKTNLQFSEPTLEIDIIGNYNELRDFPAKNHTTHLGIALRFGTISVRKCIDFARRSNETWLNQLIWRDFFMQILFHFPNVENNSFKPKYDAIPWINNVDEFQKWCEGKTGYALVDAGMRELNTTGFMHNRVRMLVASFLTKHLLIDWRWGEAYFAQKLNDYDLALNNGNWQWAAGCGCDAAPYFRIFNPDEQLKKFDSNLEYINKWVKEFSTLQYYHKIIEHSFARNRALETFKKTLSDF